ncbi:hypothetical protein ACFQGT_18220 [Natrialbaceae archaeon GCM10025810]|uniref:hypothetical protein n=1 Tax=Halovalidus salilacus TaxID=3075124 RepID=UPI003612B832
MVEGEAYEMSIEELKKKVAYLYGNIIFHEEMMRMEDRPAPTPEYARLREQLREYSMVLAERMGPQAYQEFTETIEEEKRKS